MSIHTKYRYGVWCDHCDAYNDLPTFTHAEAHSEEEARQAAIADGWLCERFELPRKKYAKQKRYKRHDLCPRHAVLWNERRAACVALGAFLGSLSD